MVSGEHKIDVKFPNIYDPFYSNVELDQNQVNQIIIHHL